MVIQLIGFIDILNWTLSLDIDGTVEKKNVYFYIQLIGLPIGILRRSSFLMP